jgi:hypothetical protein
MYSKIITLFCCLLFLASKNFAEDATSCKAAKDSMKVQFNRNEMGFFTPSRMVSNMFNYFVITKDYYKKVPVKAFVKDTSLQYKTCYNKAFQLKLDSAFKCDFFRSSDSILKAYDAQGKGYRNAEFPGGAGALVKFMEKNVSLAKDSKPSDADKYIRIYASFAIDEKGNLSDYKILKSNCKECEELVLAAIKKIDKFLPAIEAGKPKVVRYILPFVRK